VENTGQRVHIKFTGRMGEFASELHYVLAVGETGFHCYVVFRHGAGDAATYLEQARMVLRCDKNVFTHAFTSEQKSGQMIAPSLLAGAPEIMDATLELPATSSYTTPTGTTDDGLPVYTKYDWADFVETHKAHGLAGASTGLWMLGGSEECINGGPTKSELFVHGTDTTPLMIATFHAAHFIGSDSNLQLAAGEVWEKLYGPYFIYLNSGAGAGAQTLWQDALQRATAEKAAWPLAWMNEAAYPVARGAVAGRLLAAGAPAANALMVLAQPGSDWQAQGRGYQFWTRTDAAGNFTIPKVRPGNYSLYACAPGVSGQMELAQISVAAGATNDVGRLSWAPPRRAQTLWQIGTPDRSAAEFRLGDQMRQFGLWWRYLETQGTGDLNYTVGTSTAANWYYAQVVMPLDDGSYLTPRWNVLFSLATVPTGQAELVIDFAGAMSGTLNLTLNNTSIGSLAMVNDAGIYRSATRLSRYRQQRVTFNASLLRTGSNTLRLQLNGRSNWSGTKPSSPASGVMYDAIRLEAGAAAAESLVREYALNVSAGPGGAATGGGYYAPGATVELRATATAGYRFTRWSDDSTAVVRSVVVNGAANYAAEFEQTPQGAFDAWAAATLLVERDWSFAGDADGDGVANGIEFAYGPAPASAGLLQVRVIGGVPTAVVALASTPAGAEHTSLQVEATSDLRDWIAGAVALTESQVGAERRWTPQGATGPGAGLFFRAVLRLDP
jgi:rhamnogalacturonan endolyase